MGQPQSTGLFHAWEEAVTSWLNGRSQAKSESKPKKQLAAQKKHWFVQEKELDRRDLYGIGKWGASEVMGGGRVPENVIAGKDPYGKGMKRPAHNACEPRGEAHDEG